MKKTTLLFEATLEIYLVVRSNGIIRYHLAHSQPSRSFVKQWVQAIRSQFNYLAEPNIRDTSNVLRSVAAGGWRMDAAAANSLYGIVLGTGDTPVAIGDYKLQTQIVHGLAAGQLDHKIAVFDAFEVVGSVAKFRFKRQYENKSGGTITVKEAGAYSQSPGSWYVCLIRDVLAAPFDILNTQIAEFRYTFKATV